METLITYTVFLKDSYGLEWEILFLIYIDHFNDQIRIQSVRIRVEKLTTLTVRYTEDIRTSRLPDSFPVTYTYIGRDDSREAVYKRPVPETRRRSFLKA